MKDIISKSQIEKFISQTAFAVVGVSRNKKKFGYSVYNEMKNKGFKVYPVNPNTDNIVGDACFNSIADLPEDTGSVILLSQKSDTAGLITQAMAKGIYNIWVQQGSETQEVIDSANEGKANIIHGHCILMFTKPSGFHSFHRFFLKIFGLLPK